MFNLSGTHTRIVQKDTVILVMFIANAILTALSWVFPEVWYVFVPFIGAAAFANSCMVISLLAVFSYRGCQHLIRTNMATKRPLDVEANESTEKQISQSLAFVVPCYNESREEIEETLTSLLEQEGLEEYKKLFIVCCDGKVKAAGAQKTTAAILQEDIFGGDSIEFKKTFVQAYKSWTGTKVSLDFQSGVYKGRPYILIIKDENRGKRDTLVLVRTLLHKRNINASADNTRFSLDFYNCFNDTCISFHIMQHDYLVGTDADTLFEQKCTKNMLAVLEKDEKIAGVAGIVRIRFRPNTLGFWTLYQHGEYLRGQTLRRVHQSEVTRQVTCLPGACQMFRVRESTCGDAIMDKFAYHPQESDNLITVVRAFGGEDRNHVAILFSLFPKDTTRVCLTANCFTDPPQSWKVFLSQRRRWSLSTQTNNLITIFYPGQNIWERFCSIIDILEWMIPVFIFVTLAQVIRAFIFHTNWRLLVGLSAVIVLPWLWAIGTIVWIPINNRDRVRYTAGLFLVLVCASFVNVIVTAYTVWNMTDYSWGKTRALAEEDEQKNTPIPTLKSTTEQPASSTLTKPLQVQQQLQVDPSLNDYDSTSAEEDNVILSKDHQIIALPIKRNIKGSLNNSRVTTISSPKQFEKLSATLDSQTKKSLDQKPHLDLIPSLAFHP